MGIAKSYAESARDNIKWHDLDMRIDGPATFAECEEGSEAGNSRVIPVYSNPMFRHKTPLLDHCMSALRASKTEVRLYSPYFVPRRG